MRIVAWLVEPRIAAGRFPFFRVFFFTFYNFLLAFACSSPLKKRFSVCGPFNASG